MTLNVYLGIDVGSVTTKLALVDEKGKKYPLIFDCTHCEMAVLNY